MVSLFAGFGAPKRRLEGCQEKALDGALVPLPAGLGVSKRHFGGFGGFGGFGEFGGFGGFEAWETAGLNAKKKLLMWP